MLIPVNPKNVGAAMAHLSADQLADVLNQFAREMRQKTTATYTGSCKELAKLLSADSQMVLRMLLNEVDEAGFPWRVRRAAMGQGDD